MRTHLKLRLEAQPNTGNVEVTVFCGQEGFTLQNAGRLILSVGEWQLFGAALSLGANQGSVAVHMRMDIENEQDALNRADRYARGES